METPGEQLLTRKKRCSGNQGRAAREVRNHGEAEDNTEKGAKPEHQPSWRGREHLVGTCLDT